MSIPQVPANSLAADTRSLNNLKLNAGQNSPEAIKETAKQLESLFMRELIKSMREATMKSGLTDGDQANLGTDLLDQQLSVSMSGLPGGLSDTIARQLSRQMGMPDPTPASKTGTPVSNNTSGKAAISAYTSAIKPTASQTGFVQKLSAAAANAEKLSGIPASYMIGQAGHETGWGQHEIRNKDGSPSFNLFGIKAGANWSGKVTEVTTTEYINGEPKKTVAKFRAYSSYEESFKDYARLINESPRYAQARQQTGSVQAFASGLQRAGYATDPQYAAKLSRAIQTTQHLQRAQA